MKKIAFGILMLLGLSSLGFSQDLEWEPQTSFTGYGALEYNYFKDLQFFDRDYATALTEAGVLASYKPKENLTLKTVFVYRPGYNFSQMLNEVNAEYKFTDLLKFKGGRFLTPLSPSNTYYYAPVNTSATLPMLIQNHEFFPLNIDGISANGNIGGSFKADYDVFFGGFHNALWLKTGSRGLFADENNYFQRVINLDTIPLNTSNANDVLHVGGGAHVGFSYEEYITIGFNTFRSNEKVIGEMPDGLGGELAYTTTVKKSSYGLNAMFRYSTVKLIGEYWKTTAAMNLFGMNLDLTYKGAFAELSNTFGKITPYLRYEYHEIPGNKAGIAYGQDYYRYTGGINYKPQFETTFKLEYLYYKYESLDLSGIVATFIFSF
jgi:hypothetical protein